MPRRSCGKFLERSRPSREPRLVSLAPSPICKITTLLTCPGTAFGPKDGGRAFSGQQGHTASITWVEGKPYRRKECGVGTRKRGEGNLTPPKKKKTLFFCNYREPGFFFSYLLLEFLLFRKESWHWRRRLRGCSAPLFHVSLLALPVTLGILRFRECRDSRGIG